MKSTKGTLLPTPYGVFTIIAFESSELPDPAVALVLGNPSQRQPALVRIHSQCLTGDVFGSGRCDCGDQLQFALRKIGEEGHGVVVYQLQEGRGIGLVQKLLAYELQDLGLDTVEANLHLGFEADHRNYQLCTQILIHLGIHRVRLMSNNPGKFEALAEAGILVEARVPIEIAPSDTTEHYLKTKKEKMGHLLSRV